MPLHKKANQLQRKLHTVYQLVPLASPPGVNPFDAPLLPAEDYSVQGELDDYIIVSVPTTTSQNAAESLRKRLTEAVQRPVILVTHNIHFLRARKMSSAEARKTIKRAEAGLEQITREVLARKNAGAESVEPPVSPGGEGSLAANGGADDPGAGCGDGGGSGLRLVGGGGDREAGA